MGGIALRGRYIAVVALGAAALTLVIGGSAEASAQVCPPSPISVGVGTLGTPWVLKGLVDVNGPGGTPVVGAEFAINTQVAGQVWSITFADDGVVFFTADDVSTATGIREARSTAEQPGTVQHLTVHAVNDTTGETIDGAVDVPSAAGCRHEKEPPPAWRIAEGLALG
jgi:hypothetical protein